MRLEPSPDVEGSWVVADVAMAYGGVAPKSIMATQVGVQLQRLGWFLVFKARIA